MEGFCSLSKHYVVFQICEWPVCSPCTMPLPIPTQEFFVITQVSQYVPQNGAHDPNIPSASQMEV